MYIVDAIFYLDQEKTIERIEWQNPHFANIYQSRWDHFAGHSFFRVFTNVSDSPALIRWGEDSFQHHLMRAGGDGFICVIKQYADKLYLLERALDRMEDGVQVYDKNACLVFLNSASRKISDISDHVDVEGKHLLDLYNLEDDNSTVLTTLRTKTPMINRFGRFMSAAGSHIATTNTGYPILDCGELMGTVVFEQDRAIVDRQLSRLEEIKKAMRRRDMHLSSNRFTGYCFDNILGSGERLMEAVDVAKRVAHYDTNVMLIGETGTGKEIFAQSIHKASRRADKKFVATNCAAVPDTLAESVFFGTQKGAFTGSIDRPGLLEEASGGTLFLDELNSMSLLMQSKLLRAIQENTFRRVGGSADIKADIRFISSCNVFPEELLANNIVRKDLYYRLSAAVITLPALRDHAEDVDALAADYIRQKSHNYTKKIMSISAEALAALRRWPWPGNVRELHHAMDYALNVTDSEVIQIGHLPRHIRDINEPPQPDKASSEVEEMWRRTGLQRIMDQYESVVLQNVLDHYGYNISKAAASLGIRRQSLQYRIKKHGIVTY